MLREDGCGAPGAGRAPGYRHLRPTGDTIARVLSRLLLDIDTDTDRQVQPRGYLRQGTRVLAAQHAAGDVTRRPRSGPAPHALPPRPTHHAVGCSGVVTDDTVRE
ncbi:hypothetical protein CLM85_00565, partial [Streptomyces albidoflavus]